MTQIMWLAAFSFFSSMTAFADSVISQCSPVEARRVEINNVEDGLIRGSRDGGTSWTTLGRIIIPVRGGTWIPAKQGGVLAFNFLRGPSSIFASAVNNIHIRFSDPAGYQLPADVNVPPIDGKGITLSPLLPLEQLLEQNAIPTRMALTDMEGGHGLFAKEWSPRVGDQVFVTNGVVTHPIEYNDSINVGRRLLIVSTTSSCEIEYLEFQNRVGGYVISKRTGEAATAIARVTKPVKGVGRFEGSEHLQRPGQIRCNHAGVLDIGTTDYNTVGGEGPVIGMRGGFQVVPSFHFADASMNNGWDHPFVYLVVAPLNGGTIRRYDQGLEGSYPLFTRGMRAGAGTTHVKFSGNNSWYEMNYAVTSGMFTDGNGKKVWHLRGIIPNVFHNVTDFRIVNEAL